MKKTRTQAKGRAPALPKGGGRVQVTEKKTPRKATNIESKPAAVSVAPEKTAESETANERRFRETRESLEAMIAQGKDQTEAAIFYTIDHILGKASWGLDVSTYLKYISPKQRARHASLKWIAQDILKCLIWYESSYSVQHAKGPYAHPAFAEYWKTIRTTAADLFKTQDNVDLGIECLTANWRAKKPSGFTKKRLQADYQKLRDLTRKSKNEQEQLYLVIGFVLGVRSRCRKLEQELKRIHLDVLKDFTIKKPQPDRLSFRFGVHREALRMYTDEEK